MRNSSLQTPSSLVSLANFGAVADGKTNNLTAIQNAINYAEAHGMGVYVPSGTFAYSGQIEDPGVAITGDGLTSVLTALDPSSEDIHITGNGASVSYINLQGNGTTRLSAPWNEPIWADHATNFTVANITVNNGAAGSIMSYGSSGGLIENNTITNSLADSITAIDGSSNITVKNNLIENSGDDGISVVSYVGSPIDNGITITGNTVIGNYGGRGVTDVGGNNVQITGNHIEGGTAGVAGIYVAAESSWNTQGINGATVTGNTIIHGGGAPSGTGMGAITLFDGQGSAYSLKNITVSGNQIVDPLNNALQYTGNGVIQATVSNNTDYSSNPFSSNGNSLASISEIGNTVKSPSSYTAPLVPAGTGAASAPLHQQAAMAVVTLGSGSDTLTVDLSEDAWQGDAQFTVSVDGKQLDGIFQTTASHTTGASQAFTFKGDFGTGNHTVAVNFLNDAYGGSPTADRNLYINDVIYNGTDTGQTAALMSDGAADFTVTGGTTPPDVTVGAGQDTVLLDVSQDAWNGNAQFTVKVDGQQVGGTLTAPASHAAGAEETVAMKGDFGSGSHTVAVTFTNDAYGGTPSTDRNLYVDKVIYNGVDSGQSATLYSNGPKSFVVSGGTNPTMQETSDHGSLALSLSQIGTYQVGGDTFVTGTNKAVTATLGGGSSQLTFIGPSSLQLSGGSGSTVILADAGTDTFTAGSGAMDVTGGAGKDAYVFHTTSGKLAIEDFSFSAGDTLVLDKAMASSMQQAPDYMGGTMLTFGANQSIDLKGVAVLPNTAIHWA